jgi:hypothetical protein
MKKKLFIVLASVLALLWIYSHFFGKDTKEEVEDSKVALLLKQRLSVQRLHVSKSTSAPPYGWSQEPTWRECFCYCWGSTKKSWSPRWTSLQGTALRWKFSGYDQEPDILFDVVERNGFRIFIDVLLQFILACEDRSVDAFCVFTVLGNDESHKDWGRCVPS